MTSCGPAEAQARLLPLSLPSGELLYTKYFHRNSVDSERVTVLQIRGLWFVQPHCYFTAELFKYCLSCRPQFLPWTMVFVFAQREAMIPCRRVVGSGGGRRCCCFCCFCLVLFFSYNNYQLHKRLMPQYKHEKPQYSIVLEWNSSARVLRVKVSNVRRKLLVDRCASYRWLSSTSATCSSGVLWHLFVSATRRQSVYNSSLLTVFFS